MSNLEKAKEALKSNQPEPATSPQGPYVILNATTPAAQPVQQVTPVHPIRQNLIDLAATIRTQRVAKNLTQRQLAHLANVSQGSITRAERDIDISLFMLVKITHALDKKLWILD